MIVVIDNYDSFTYNLVQLLRLQDDNVLVVKSDWTNKDQILRHRDHIKAFLLSPGPGHPREARLNRWVLEQFHTTRPILGVCLGHQVIAEFFGGKIIKAPQPVHGKLSEIHHHNEGSFKDLKNPLRMVRYHSLMVEREGLPEDLIVHAWTHDGLIMGLKHRLFSVEGVQFHPESILSEQGEDLIKNFYKSITRQQTLIS